jgi:hypothetical protein
VIFSFHLPLRNGMETCPFETEKIPMQSPSTFSTGLPSIASAGDFPNVQPASSKELPRTLFPVPAEVADSGRIRMGAGCRLPPAR